MNNLLSSSYLEQLMGVHNSRLWGASGYSHAPIVKAYRDKLKAQSILDYGCGRATLKNELLKLDPKIDPALLFEFDPAIPGKDDLPKPVDLLVANDVLEHIEPDYLESTLEFIRSLALKGAYFTIALTPSKVSLPDGRNSHLIIKSQEWWQNALMIAGFEIKKAEMRKGLWVWA